MRIRTEDDFGALVRQRRRDLGMSQATLATRAGVTRQWVVRFEKGNSDVALSKAFTVMRELGLVVRADPADVRATSVPIPSFQFKIPKIEVGRIAIDQMREALSKIPISSLRVEQQPDE
ncbi:MAG: helix-turn-helix domain-containing protein [Pseudolysinimonas sp.]